MGMLVYCLVVSKTRDDTHSDRDESAAAQGRAHDSSCSTAVAVAADVAELCRGLR
jgi:hypothetical protein